MKDTQKKEWLTSWAATPNLHPSSSLVCLLQLDQIAEQRQRLHWLHKHLWAAHFYSNGGGLWADTTRDESVSPRQSSLFKYFERINSLSNSLLVSLLKHIYFSIFGKETTVLFLESHFIEGIRSCVKRCSARKKGQARMPRLNLHNYFGRHRPPFKIEM